MTPADVYRAMALPPRAELGKRVFKKLFLEHTSMTPADKRVLTDEVDQVVWQYALKQDTVGLKPHVEGERDYLEIAILEAQLKGRTHTRRVAELIHRAIPYPVFLVVYDTESVALSTAHKRVSRAVQDAIVAAPPHISPWLDETKEGTAFLSSMRFDAMPRADVFELYAALSRRILALMVSTATGRFAVDDRDLAADEQRQDQLQTLQTLERDLARSRAELHAESSFARKVELNVLIKNQERRLAALKAVL